LSGRPAAADKYRGHVPLEADGKLHPLMHRRKIMMCDLHGRAGRNQMPEAEIRRLLKNLGESINETLADSPRINERLQEIRDAGYEVFLVIEAKIGFSRKSYEEGETDPAIAGEPVRLHITPEDAKFLQSLKISV
jgi:hypothetical protein